MNFRKLLTTGAVMATAMAFGLGAVQAAEVDGPKVKWNVSLWGKKRAFTAGVEKLSALVKREDRRQLDHGPCTMAARCPSRARTWTASRSTRSRPPCSATSTIRKKNPALMVADHAVPADERRGTTTARSARRSTPIPPVKKELAQLERHDLRVVLPAAVRVPRPRQAADATLADWKGLTVRAGGGVGPGHEGAGRDADQHRPRPRSIPASSRARWTRRRSRSPTAHVAYKIHEVSEWFTSNLSPGTSDCPLVFSINAL